MNNCRTCKNDISRGGKCNYYDVYSCLHYKEDERGALISAYICIDISLYKYSNIYAGTDVEKSKWIELENCAFKIIEIISIDMTNHQIHVYGSYYENDLGKYFDNKKAEHKRKTFKIVKENTDDSKKL